MTATTWGKLRKNDRILCPRDGLPEKVTMSEPRPGGRRFVRTDKHDHNRPRDEAIELA